MKKCVQTLNEHISNMKKWSLLILTLYCQKQGFVPSLLVLLPSFEVPTVGSYAGTTVLLDSFDCLNDLFQKATTKVSTGDITLNKLTLTTYLTPLWLNQMLPSWP